MKAADFVASLRECSRSKDLRRGIALHESISKRSLIGVCSDDLVIMYARCGRISESKELLEKHMCRDLVSWTALIAAYVRCGQGRRALDCFQQMRRVGLSPDSITFACALRACGSIKETELGQQIHNEVARKGLLRNSVILGNALVDMYSKCGILHEAQQALEQLPLRNNVTWNALISGYAQNCEGERALFCFEKMEQEGVLPDAVTYTCILKACACIRAVDKGKQIHNKIVRRGLLENDVILGTALVDMYAKCGSFVQAHEVLEEIPIRNVFCWSALISGYVEQGYGEHALSCYEAMKHDGVLPNRVTFLSVLKACGTIKATEIGEQIHEEISKQGLLKEDITLANSLADMYAKCGALSKAEEVLKSTSFRDIVSWSTLIAGYAQQGLGEKAFLAFEKMQVEGIFPNAVTFACILKACGSMGAIDRGEHIHEDIVRQGLLERNVLLGNALVDMYSSCGALRKAQKVVEELSIRNASTWNTLIAGYAQQGQCEQALISYDTMQREGFSADKITFTYLLKACGSIGAVHTGEQIHDIVVQQRLLKNDIKLSTAVVDMYTKCGSLAKAHQMLQEFPFPNEILYSPLLTACDKQVDVNVGKWAFENAAQVNCKDALIYTQMAKIYAAVDT